MSRVSAAIHESANVFQLNPRLVAAVVFIESGGDAGACRAEPGFFKRYIENKPLQYHVPHTITEDTERWFRSISWGLMQIMGETARMLGYRGILHELLEPRVNTAIGCQYLSLLLAQKVELPKALFAYNHGPGSTFKDGVAGKPEYHERVITHMDSPRINFLLQM